ncbi:MAG: hypothetical protein KAU16_01675 [Methanophagales archaeon]|nr:hypothetical protein [Methanophagales archaeon]
MGKEGKSVDMKNMSFAWCEPMKGRKGEEGRRRGVALKKEVREKMEGKRRRF